MTTINSKNTFKLSEILSGESAVIQKIHSEQTSFVHRMYEVGLTPGAEIKVMYEPPFGGGIAVSCRGAIIALRISDAYLIEVVKTDV